MIIQQIAAPGMLAGPRLRLATADGESVTVVAGKDGAPTPPAKADPKSTALIAPLLKEPAVPMVAGGGYWLVSNINTVTPEQFASELGKFHIVSDPGFAHQQASDWLAVIQSKGGNAIMLGGVAGATVFTIVETVRPAWSFEAKVAIALAVAVVTAAFLYFAFPEKPPVKAPPPAPNTAAPR
jgi:hypothetical protein